MGNLIDLHVHTTYSDGTYSPTELIDRARKEDIQALAITDHDTVAGNTEALEHGNTVGFEVVPGVEISVESSYNSYHILGYFIDHTNPALVSTLQEVLDFRDNRNPKIIAKLNELGMDITLEEVTAEAGGTVIGRPHMAAVMLKKGYVDTIQAAFDKYLKTGAAAHVDKKRITQEEGIRLISESGGIPVWAHPGFIRWKKPEEMEEQLTVLIEYGLKGIEVFYTSHTPEMTKKFKRLAKKYNLLVTGGSDYHGETKKDIMLAKGRGNLAVDYEYLEKLKEHL